MNAEHAPFRHYLDLADARLGSQVVAVSDEWFAPASRMLQAGEPVWKEGVFDDSGKWMDGWETRRKRFEGHDQAVIRLGVPGVLKGVDIDTRFFTGNHPPAASLDGCFCTEGDPDDSTSWSEVLPAVGLQGDSHHYHPIDDERPWTHLRLNIYPDGGIARLRLYGVPYRDWSSLPPGTALDLAAAVNGGRALACSDQHFGRMGNLLNPGRAINMGDGWETGRRRTPYRDWSSLPPGTALDLAAAVNGGRALACSDQHFGRMGNLLNPGRAINMGDGWETGRRRTPGHDWVIVALGHPGSIEAAVVDTLHFKGNYPESCSIQAAFVEGGNEARIEAQSLFWRELLPAQKLEMHQEHRFERHLNALGPITHVRLNIFPDGGVSRLRLFGRPQLP
ncbi:allantoicase [Pseudomonas aeruginosa]